MMEADEGSCSLECDNKALVCQLPLIRHPLSGHDDRHRLAALTPGERAACLRVNTAIEW
jgi:hypothetical protein